MRPVLVLDHQALDDGGQGAAAEFGWAESTDEETNFVERRLEQHADLGKARQQLGVHAGRCTIRRRHAPDLICSLAYCGLGVGKVILQAGQQRQGRKEILDRAIVDVEDNAAQFVFGD